MTPTEQFDDLAISIILRKSDLYRSALESLTRQKVWRFIVIWMYLLAWAASNTQPYAWAYALPESAAFCVLMVCAFAWMSARTPGVLNPMTLVFSEEGVALRMVNSANIVEWPLAKGARESKRYIVVEMRRNSYHLIPKAQISDETAARLRSILHAKLGDKARLFAN